MTNRTSVSDRPWRRRGLGVLAAAAALLATGCGGVQWQSRLEPALQRAGRFNQLVLVQFRTWTDATCIEADNTVFANNDVIKALNEYQCVRLDYMLNASLADRWGVTVVPTYLVLRPDGSVVDRRSGQVAPDEFRAFLKWAALRR